MIKANGFNYARPRNATVQINAMPVLCTHLLNIDIITQRTKFSFNLPTSSRKNPAVETAHKVSKCKKSLEFSLSSKLFFLIYQVG